MYDNAELDEFITGKRREGAITGFLILHAEIRFCGGYTRPEAFSPFSAMTELL